MFEKPVQKITFADVASFCSKQHPATIQLEYVRDITDLPRRIAALANTFGGYIIVGVLPNPRTGQPSRWKGVLNGSRVIEHLERAVSAVAPYPHCTIHKTSSRDRHVFLVIHVAEGRYGPYYVTGEPHTVWIRNEGRIPMVPATRQDIMRIREKQDLVEWPAERSRHMFSLLHNEAEVTRAATRTPDDGQSVYTPGLLEGMPLLSMHIRPRHSVRGLLGVESQALQQWVSKLRPPYDNSVYTPHFPEPETQPIPDGVAGFYWHEGADNRDVHCDQLYSDGTLHHIHSVLQYVDAEPAIYLTTVAMELYDFLAAASALYIQAGYRGALDGSIAITAAKGLQTVAALPLDRSPFPSSLRTIPFTEQAWPIVTNTRMLTDLHTFLDFNLCLMERIHWDLRASSYSHEQLHTALWQAGRTKVVPVTDNLVG